MVNFNHNPREWYGGVMKFEMKKGLILKLPMLPNFIRTAKCSIPYAIKEFTEDELREIGRLWTEELVRKGAKA